MKKSYLSLKRLGGVALTALIYANVLPAKGANVPQEAALTHWTPWGTATFVQAEDPALAMPTESPRPTVAKPSPGQIQAIIQLAEQCLTELSERTSDADTQYYEKGDWRFTNQLLACDAGPAGLAAALWKYRQTHPESMDSAAKAKQEWLYRIAVETVERGIALHDENGKLKNPGSHAVFWYLEFASIYNLLKDSLSPETRNRWQEVMRGEVKALQASGDLPDPTKAGWKGTDGWYTNGNVDICHAAWIYQVWQAIGDEEYKALFERCWKHTLFPSQIRWKGYGLYLLKAPTKLDGSDGSGYITEANAKPGFDKSYGAMQLSIVARHYVKSRDPRALRVTNLLCNALWPHVDKETMVLNAMYGSRKSEIFPFYSCAPEVLTWLGGRSDFQSEVSPHFDKAIAPYFTEKAAQNKNDPGFYRACGFDLAALLEAAAATGK